MSEQKQGAGRKIRVLWCPLHVHLSRGHRPPKSALQLDPWTHPTLHPIKGTSLHPLESKQANLLQVFTASCNCRGPSKALPEFLLFGEGQESLSMGFSRQEYWSGLPFPLPGDLPDPRIKPVPLTSPALAGRFFTAGVTWEAWLVSKPLRNWGAAKLRD